MKGRSGGARLGAGRKLGGKNRTTTALRLAVERERLKVELAGEIVAEKAARVQELPSRFLVRVMADESLPLPLRIAAAAKAATFIEPRPDPGMSTRIPLPRTWTETQLEDFWARLEADRQAHPELYGDDGAPRLLIGMKVPE